MIYSMLRINKKQNIYIVEGLNIDKWKPAVHLNKDGVFSTLDGALDYVIKLMKKEEKDNL